MKIHRQLSAAFLAMQGRQHLIYWVLPLLVISTIALAYFAGPGWLQNIIAPPVNRELGLLETLEHLLILAIVVICFVSFLNEAKLLMKIIFLLFTLVAAFLFLEEIDFGDHYIRYFGTYDQADTVIHNFHNQEKNTINKLMKLCYVIIGLVFIILPYLKKEKLPVWLQQLTPSPRLQFAVFALPLIGQFPMLLNKMGFITNGSLTNNLAEFEELGIYYVFLLYFIEMYHKLDFLSSTSAAVYRERMV